MMMPTVMTALTFQRRRQFAEADIAVAIGVELVENAVGLRGVGAAGAERVFEFRFCDLAVAIGVDLREQVLQRGRLALRRQQRLHGGGRNLRSARKSRGGRAAT